MIELAKPREKLIEFLREELQVPTESIALALRDPALPFGSLPMILWQYGLITLQQLDSIFEWIERQGYQAD
ncbi:MAG: DUF2949 domain-containing protein [Microcystaceae cyanobacterium]